MTLPTSHKLQYCGTYLQCGRRSHQPPFWKPAWIKVKSCFSRDPATHKYTVCCMLKFTVSSFYRSTEYCCRLAAVVDQHHHPGSFPAVLSANHKIRAIRGTVEDRPQMHRPSFYILCSTQSLWKLVGRQGDTIVAASTGRSHNPACQRSVIETPGVSWGTGTSHLLAGSGS